MTLQYQKHDVEREKFFTNKAVQCRQALTTWVIVEVYIESLSHNTIYTFTA
jgi:hypothetical protein